MHGVEYFMLTLVSCRTPRLRSQERFQWFACHRASHAPSQLLRRCENSSVLIVVCKRVPSKHLEYGLDYLQSTASALPDVKINDIQRNRLSETCWKSRLWLADTLQLELFLVVKITLYLDPYCIPSWAYCTLCIRKERREKETKKNQVVASSQHGCRGHERVEGK